MTANSSIVARTLAAASTLAIAATLNGPALAQSTVAPEPTPRDSGATSAAAAPVDDGGIADIIVTAQRRQEALSRVPVAATVVTGEAFEKDGNYEIEDLEKLSPSVTFDATTSDRNNSVRIRGVGSNTTSSGTEPSTSTVFDEVVLVRSGQSSTLQLGDVERFEVLRGPQGTLFGKNSSSGVINVTTKRPRFESEAILEASQTSDEETIFKATVGGGLTEKVAARASFFYRDWAGNVESVRDGRTLNGQNAIGARARFLFEPSDDTDFVLSVNYGRKDASCCVRVIYGAPTPLTPQAAAEVTQLLPVVPFFGNIRANVDTISKDNSDSFLPSLIVNHRIGGFTLTSVTSYQYFEIDQLVEDDQTGTDPFVGGFATKQAITSLETINAFTQELRVASPTWDSIDFVAGLYYFKASVDQSSTNQLRDLVAGVVRRRDSTFFSDTEFQNYAAFGQANLRPFEGFTILAGLRYTHDDIDNDYLRDDAAVPFRNGDISYSRSASSNNLSGKAGISYQFSPSVFVYGTYARGYKGPGFNVASNGGSTVGGVVIADTTLKPEISDSFDIGTKLTLFNRRLTVNIAAFKATYNDFVINSFDLTTNSVRLRNAAEVRTKGIEMDFAARPFRLLSLSGGLAYVRSEFDVPQTFCFGGQTVAQGCVGGLQDIAGGDTPNSPNLKGNISGTYTIEGGDRLPFNLALQANYRWQSKVQFDLAQSPRGFYEAYGIADASIAATTPDGNYRAEIFVKNLFDRFYANALSATALSGLQTYFLPRDSSRYGGVRLVAKF